MAQLTHDQFTGFTANADLHFAALKEMLDEEEASYAS
jgi:hypothetical protein